MKYHAFLRSGILAMTGALALPLFAEAPLMTVSTFDQLAGLGGVDAELVQVLKGHVKASGKFGGGGQFAWKVNPPTGRRAENRGTVFHSAIDATGCWERIYSGPVNAQWFGALADGTDDLNAIQAAINATRSGTVHLPKGRYMLSNALDMREGCLTGDGMYVNGTELALIPGSRPSAVVRVDDSGYARISGLMIDGNTPAGGAAGAIVHGLQLRGGSIYGHFERIRITNTSGNGIQIDPRDHVMTPNIVTFIGCEVSDAWRNGIRIAGGKNITFINQAVERCGQLEGGLCAISVCPDAVGAVPANITFIAPYIENIGHGRGGYGIQVANSANVTIENAWIQGYGRAVGGSGGHAIWLDRDARQVLVKGGTFIPEGGASSPGCRKIFIDPTCSQVTLLNLALPDGDIEGGTRAAR